jgi:protein-S-isoprenylcysteine O-methyltransferase Ste14
MKKLEHRIPPPILLMAVALAMGVVAHSFPETTVLTPWRYGGVVLFGALALGFAGPGIRAFLRAGTTINPVNIVEASQLVTGGIFGVTRNPMYVALTLLLIAWDCWLASPWLLAGPLAFALFIHRFQILPEERVLAAKFGPEYSAYSRRVRRWL